MLTSYLQCYTFRTKHLCNYLIFCYKKKKIITTPIHLNTILPYFSISHDKKKRYIFFFILLPNQISLMRIFVLLIYQKHRTLSNIEIIIKICNSYKQLFDFYFLNNLAFFFRFYKNNFSLTFNSLLLLLLLHFFFFFNKKKQLH